MQNPSDTRRRVKVYQLNEDRQWDDRGTGHVQTSFDSATDVCSLLVKSETDAGQVLLDSEIRQDTNYSKQQETLIVWSEDNSDLALSFQERTGCEEIWEKICNQQGRDPDANDPDETIQSSDDDEIDLPAPEIAKLNQIRECFNTQNRMMRREKLSAALKDNSYIPKLLDVFKKCEDVADDEALKTLYEIFKSIWMLNQGDIYEILFKQDYIFDVVGVMEYDPSRKTNPVKHREFLKSRATFKDVLFIKDEALRNKINQTYRMQYVQESVLPAPSMFEQDNLSTLASFVFFSKVDIVKMILKDPDTIGKCLSDLKDPATPASRQAELCGFLKEFFIYSGNLQQPEKENFLELLLQRGILTAIEVLLQSEYGAIRTYGSELICQITELNQQPSIVRDHIMKAHRENNPNDLMSLLLNVMLNDPDPELGTAIQLITTIRMLLDPENMLRTSTEKSDFLSFFYRVCVVKLTTYLQQATTLTSIKHDDYRTAHTLDIIMMLFLFMVEHHTYHIKNHILHKDTLKRAMLLINSKYTSLSLSALRLLRKIIGKGDDSYNSHLIKKELLAELVEALFKNGRRYNLLNSAILETFKYIKDENIKSLIHYLIDNHWAKLKLIKYSNLFEQMKEKHDQNRAHQERRNGGEQSAWEVRRYRDPRQLDDKQREWFERESDEEESGQEPPKSLVDYENSDSEPENDKEPVNETENAESNKRESNEPVSEDDPKRSKLDVEEPAASETQPVSEVTATAPTDKPTVVATETAETSEQETVVEKEKTDNM